MVGACTILKAARRPSTIPEFDGTRASPGSCCMAFSREVPDFLQIPSDNAVANSF